jgi:hypothetical protein
VDASSERPVGLLNRQQIRERVEKIFANDDWDDDCIRDAAYDVRVSGVGLRFPNHPEYTRARPRRQPFVLRPGDVAFVSTVERFRLHPSLSATISPKYDTVSQGWLLLHGGLIDPGFGFRSDDAPENGLPEGEPLSFLVANVSGQDIVITPQVTKVAGIQFTEIAERSELPAPSKGTLPEPDEGDATTRAEEVRSRDSPTLGLEFFSQMGKTRQEMDSIAHQSQNVVVFGIYLLAFATIGAVAAVIIAVLASYKPGRAADALNGLSDSLGIKIVLIAVFASAAFALWGRLRDRVRGRPLGSGGSGVARAVRRADRRRRTNAYWKLGVHTIRQQSERRAIRRELAQVQSLLEMAQADRVETARLLRQAKAETAPASPGSGKPE